MSDQPAESVFAIRWSLFGTRFCIRPSFWIVSAIWGFIFAGLTHHRGSKHIFLYIGLWVLCTLVSVLIHELGHNIMGRIFGQPGSITLAGMGGQATGNYEYLTPWQRIFVAFAGPNAGFLFLGLLVLFDYQHWNDLMDFFNWPLRSPWCATIHFRWTLLRTNSIYHDVVYFLFLMTLFWNLINLIPIVPMDGGMIFQELCCMISPDGGLKFAYAWSLLLAGTIALYHIVIALKEFGYIRLPVAPYTPIFPVIGAVMFSMMAWQCFQALRMISAEQKRSHYTDTFTD